jgi:ABC-type uncharacterized transport system permease subunit
MMTTLAMRLPAGTVAKAPGGGKARRRSTLGARLSGVRPAFGADAPRAGGSMSRANAAPMDSLLAAAGVLLPLAYLLAAACYGLIFFARQPRAQRAATPSLSAAVALHLAYLVALGVRWGQLPAANASQALSVMAFAVALVYLFVEWHGRDRATGFWLVSLVLVFQLLSSLLASQRPPTRELLHLPVFAAHVSLALLGYTAFAVAAAYGFLFLRLYRELKVGRFGNFFGRLPPLVILERMMVGALAVGLVALTGAVGLGTVGAARIYGSSWITDPKILFTVAIWAIYALALLLRRLRRWQGRQTAFASLAGLATILVSLVVVNFLFSGFHGFR